MIFFQQQCLHWRPFCGDRALPGGGSFGAVDGRTDRPWYNLTKNIGFRKYSKCSVWNINIQFCSILERVSESGALESEKTLFENLFGARKAIKWESFWPGPHWSSWWWFVSSLPISYYTTTDLTSEEEEDDKCLRQELKNIRTKQIEGWCFQNRQNYKRYPLFHMAQWSGGWWSKSGP